ncbi:MAG: hypothetical protein B7W98_02855, partial [Parcubacteria group bacterium 20-58-5]
ELLAVLFDAVIFVFLDCISGRTPISSDSCSELAAGAARGDVGRRIYGERVMDMAISGYQFG